jgi:hypothetical protein
MVITKEMIAEWIKLKNISPFCPLCSNNSIELGDTIVSPIMDSDGIPFTGGGRPMIQLFCDNCYHVTLFASEPIIKHFQK